MTIRKACVSINARQGSLKAVNVTAWFFLSSFLSMTFVNNGGFANFTERLFYNLCGLVDVIISKKNSLAEESDSLFNRPERSSSVDLSANHCRMQLTAIHIDRSWNLAIESAGSSAEFGFHRLFLRSLSTGTSAVVDSLLSPVRNHLRRRHQQVCLLSPSSVSYIEESFKQID
ncbi:hypothetical protein HID58_035151, partial [Brassica napus]